MNYVFFGIVAASFVFAILSGTPAEVGKAALDSAKNAVELSIGLVGYIALFLGLMAVVEKAGGLTFMARLIRPVLVRLFPDVPPDHPAMGAMVMNMAANALGLGNAATPFGLKAMKELESLNTEKGTATNAMCLFLAINTSGLALLPTSIIGLRSSKGSTDPAAIFPTTLFATGLSTAVGIVVCIALSRLPHFLRSTPAVDPAVRAQRDAALQGKSLLADMLPLTAFLGGLLALVALVYLKGEAASAWIIPSLIFGMLLVGVIRKVPVYETFVVGAKEGFQLAVTIIPYLVAILSAVGMLRASGGMATLVRLVGPVTSALGLPAELVPLALLRPLSGSGAFALTAELIDTHGPDTLIGQLASTMYGASETTFYVLAVYFGSVGIHRYRHAMWAGLAADLAGVVGSVLAVRLLLG